MKKLAFYSVIATLLLFTSSCGVSGAYIINHNQSATQVNLSSNNYQVIDKVSGSAEVPYVFMIGGMNKKQLYENAYADMIGKANLSGAKALINIVTEEHIGGVPPFYYERTITVSAHVIEFIK